MCYTIEQREKFSDKEVIKRVFLSFLFCTLSLISFLLADTYGVYSYCFYFVLVMLLWKAFYLTNLWQSNKSHLTPRIIPIAPAYKEYRISQNFKLLQRRGTHNECEHIDIINELIVRYVLYPLYSLMPALPECQFALVIPKVCKTSSELEFASYQPWQQHLRIWTLQVSTQEILVDFADLLSDRKVR